jgi:hypothetical protein
MLARLDLFGRFEFDHQKSGIDSSDIYDECVIPFLEDAKADPDGFMTDLYALIAQDTAGFPTYGAARLVWELLGSKGLRNPAAMPLIDAGIDFKLARGLPTAMLTGYEMQRLVERRAQGERM